MQFTIALSTLSLALVAQAQYGGYVPPSNSGPTTAAAAAAPAAPSAPASTSGQINVDVYPNAQFIFNPSNISAPNGTLVTFFFPTNPLTHSVTQSSFEDPCTYLAANGSTAGGFDSGLTSGSQFTINITDDTQPIWFHCKQITHCGLGMVGAINAPSSGNTFQAFQAAAMAIGSSEVTETDNGFVSGGVNAIATASAANTATSSSSTGSSDSNSSGATRMASAGTGVVAIAAALFMFA